MSKPIAFSQWLEIIDAHLSISVAFYSPTNTYINVSVKQNNSPYNSLVSEDPNCPVSFGRSDGDMETPPVLADAIENLKERFTGKRVCFERGDSTYIVPEFLPELQEV